MIKGYSRWDNIRENYGFTGCHLIEDDIVNFHVENELEGGVSDAVGENCR